MPDLAFDTLADQIHLAVVGEDLVFLDLLRDAYRCVPYGAQVVEVDAARRALRTEDLDLRHDLMTLGLTAENVGARTPTVPWTPPRRDLPEDGRLDLQGRDVPALARGLWDAATVYRRWPLHRLVSWVAADAPATATSEALFAEVRRYRRLALWTPLPRKCLLQSFLLLRHLRRAGLNATWVFGVRTWPFAAHCWLQAGEVVLNDRHERLVAYTPILVV